MKKIFFVVAVLFAILGVNQIANAQSNLEAVSVVAMNKSNAAKHGVTLLRKKLCNGCGLNLCRIKKFFSNKIIFYNRFYK